MDTVDVGELLNTGSFDLLLLPDAVRDQLGAPLETELPGTNTALEPELDLLMAGAGDLDLPYGASTANLASLAPATTTSQTVDTEIGDATGSPIGSATTDQPAAEDEHLEPQATDEPASSDEGSSVQSATAASQPSTLEQAQQAWSELSDDEKAAVSAGALALLLLGPLTMYSRISRDETLENDTRREIYGIVETTPGICIKDVADAADVSYSTASYHLDRLVKNDYLVRSEEGNKVLYYKNGGTFTKDERDLVPILKNDECMRVFEHILENPWCYRAEAAEALGVSHTTVNWHLKRLIDAGLVEEHREGRSSHLYIDDPSLNRVMDVLDKLETIVAEEGQLPMQAEEQPIPA